MTFYRMAVMIMVAAFLSIGPARAQDHAHHQMQEKPEKTCACCKNGQCPIKAEGKKCCDMPCCKNGQCPMMQGKEDHAGMSMPAGSSASEKELDVAMAIMHKDMAQPYTGDADADFIRGMIPHHAGAVEMARIELQYGDDEQARDLARRIIVAQKGEIAWMQRWLRQRQIPETGPFEFNR